MLFIFSLSNRSFCHYFPILCLQIFSYFYLLIVNESLPYHNTFFFIICYILYIPLAHMKFTIDIIIRKNKFYFTKIHFVIYCMHSSSKNCTTNFLSNCIYICIIFNNIYQISSSFFLFHLLFFLSLSWRTLFITLWYWMHHLIIHYFFTNEDDSLIYRIMISSLFLILIDKAREWKSTLVDEL